MGKMTIEDLRVSMEFMPKWVEIETDSDGEIIIRTGLAEHNGYLVDIEDLYDIHGNRITPNS